MVAVALAVVEPVRVGREKGFRGFEGFRDIKALNDLNVFNDFRVPKAPKLLRKLLALFEQIAYFSKKFLLG